MSTTLELTHFPNSTPNPYSSRWIVSPKFEPKMNISVFFFISQELERKETDSSDLFKVSPQSPVSVFCSEAQLIQPKWLLQTNMNTKTVERALLLIFIYRGIYRWQMHIQNKIFEKINKGVYHAENRRSYVFVRFRQKTVMFILRHNYNKLLLFSHPLRRTKMDKKHSKPHQP